MLFNKNVPKLKERKNIKGLISCLKLSGDKYTKTRIEAEIALKELGSISIPDLVNALNYWNSQVRSTVASILGDIGNYNVVSALIDLLADEKEIVVNAAVTALGKIGDTSAIEPVFKLLNADVQPAESIFKTLGKIGDKRAILPIIISHGTFQAKHYALVEIGKRDFLTLIEALADSKLMKYDNDNLIFSALGDIGDIRAIKPLAEQLREDYDLNTYKNILEALQKLGWHPESELGKAWFLFYDKRFDKLADIGPAALHPLLLAIKTKDNIIIKDVIKALGDIKANVAVTPLLDAANHNPDVWKDVMDALSKIGGNEAISGLFTLAERFIPKGHEYKCQSPSFNYVWEEWSTPHSKQEKIFQFFVRLGKKDSSAILMGLKNANDSVAFLAAKVLTNLHCPEAAKDVADILKADNLNSYSLSSKWAAACYIGTSGYSQWADTVLDFIFKHPLEYYGFKIPMSDHLKGIFFDLTALILQASSYAYWGGKLDEYYQISAVKELCKRVTPVTTQTSYINYQR